LPGHSGGSHGQNLRLSPQGNGGGGLPCVGGKIKKSLVKVKNQNGRHNNLAL
jgi:hypothetical protein